MRWKNDWRLQDAAARAQFGERPRDALALARFGTRATGGAEGKAARARHGDYQDMCGHVLREVQAKGHPTICEWERTPRTGRSRTRSRTPSSGNALRKSRRSRRPSGSATRMRR